ncbi:pyridoxamine 5'-phosphate oxidase family protein [Actinomadura coerulea]|uniref:pyridoxamine 5'-phosphate oxidase family protein n=1 Tax=Actinomadura coerulea TaxID=46159 RepID=UPI00343D49AD
MHADEELASIPVPRSLTERRAHARERLETGFQMWLATGSDGHGAHLIPVAYAWDGSALYTAAFAKSRTVANIKAHPQARIALGDTTDVIMIDTTASLIDVPDIDADIAENYAKVSTAPPHPPGGHIRLPTPAPQAHPSLERLSRIRWAHGHAGRPMAR